MLGRDDVWEVTDFFSDSDLVLRREDSGEINRFYAVFDLVSDRGREDPWEIKRFLHLENPP